MRMAMSLNQLSMPWRVGMAVCLGNTEAILAQQEGAGWTELQMNNEEWQFVEGAWAEDEQDIIYGATDDIGYKAVENRVSVHDFHATILHLLGLDHDKLVYDHHGLNERLTGVDPAHVVKEIMA